MTGTAAIAPAIAVGQSCAMDLLDQLNAELLTSHSATVTLEQWCAALGLADPATVRAELDRTPAPAPSRELLDRLEVERPSEVEHRRVRLLCGPHVLSIAANWYVPARLTPAMNDALAHGSSPFGRVILPLAPIRQNLSVALPPFEGGHVSGTVLRHRALVFDKDRRPLAEVTESYQAILIGGK